MLITVSAEAMKEKLLNQKHQ